MSEGLDGEGRMVFTVDDKTGLVADIVGWIYYCSTCGNAILCKPKDKTVQCKKCGKVIPVKKDT